MELCRLCLQEGGKLENISPNSSLHSKIKECVTIEIIENDGLPRTVCSTCNDKIEKWFAFKELCLASNKTLIAHKNARVKEEDKSEVDAIQEEKEDRISFFRQCKKKDPYTSDDSFSDFGYPETQYTNDDFELGEKVVIPDNTYECSICSKVFDNCMDYLDHQEEHDGEMAFKCFKCTEVFSTRKALVAHDQNHKVTCLKCGKVILKSSMKLHLIKHSDRHVCPHCSNHFNSRMTMTQHIITMHTDIKDHVCENCGKRFSSITAMRVHLKSHSNAREYKCKLCSYAGKTASAIYVHMSTHAKDVCECKVCSKIFKSNRNLYDHLRRVHSVIKRHDCRHCNKKFVDKYMLTVHMRTHTGVRPYKCNMCDKAFIRSDGLKEHLLIHSERTKHDCKNCGKKFTSKRGVTRHHCNSATLD